MRVATGPGKINELKVRGPSSVKAASMYNFDIDDSFVKPEHREWLSKNVIPLLTRNRKFMIGLKGTASRSGAAGYNLDLSRRRVNEVESFLKSNGVQAQQITHTWVGEAEAAARGTIDGKESDEDRAVAALVTGPPITKPEFRRADWLDHFDGFDGTQTPPFKMLPYFQETKVRVVKGAGWVLRGGGILPVLFVDPVTTRWVPEISITSDDQVIGIVGLMEGNTTIVGEDVFGKTSVLLDVATLEPKRVAVACLYVNDVAGHKTTRKPGDEAPMIKAANAVFNRQANVSFFASAAKPQPVKEDWGDPVSEKEMNGRALGGAIPYADPNSRISVFFVWDYEPDPTDGRDVDAQANVIGGNLVIFEDRAGRDVGLTFAHELGHCLGLPHSKASRELLMFPTTDQRGGVLRKSDILKANELVDKK